MRRLVTPLVILSVVLLTAAPVRAQFANADLAGTVVDQDGGALPGVTVTATSQATNVARTTFTAGNGTYSIRGLRPGAYSIRFELEGFQTRTLDGVELRVGEQARINAELQLGAIEEAVTVTGSAPVVEVTSKEIGGTLTTQEFETLPSQNRSALLFAALLPGVIPSPSTESTASDALFVNGQDDNNNSFNFDGANNEDDVIGALDAAADLELDPAETAADQISDGGLQLVEPVGRHGAGLEAVEGAQDRRRVAGAAPEARACRDPLPKANGHVPAEAGRREEPTGRPDGEGAVGGAQVGAVDLEADAVAVRDVEGDLVGELDCAEQGLEAVEPGRLALVHAQAEVDLGGGAAPHPHDGAGPSSSPAPSLSIPASTALSTTSSLASTSRHERPRRQT